MFKRQSILFICLVFVVIFTSFPHFKRIEQSKAENKELKRERDELRKQLNAKQLELQRSDSTRNTLVHRIDSINIVYEDLLFRDSLKSVDIRKIKGRFDKLTNVDLEREMNKRYTERVE